MLAIRMQRTGRRGHAQFRLIVQDSRFSPKRGRVVAYLGSYNPHTKIAIVDSEKATSYLRSGAQPSNRVALLLKKEGIKLPDWVKLDSPKKRPTRHPEKLRRNRPKDAKPEAAAAEEPASEVEQEAAKVSEAAETPPEVQEPTTPKEPATPQQTNDSDKPVEEESDPTPSEGESEGSDKKK